MPSKLPEWLRSRTRTATPEPSSPLDTDRPHSPSSQAQPCESEESHGARAGIKQLDLSGVPYFPLPPSPASWETDADEPSDLESGYFQIDTGPAVLAATHKLEMAERPEACYREWAGLADGCLSIDKRGRNPRFPDCQSSLLKRNCYGAPVREVGLPHDIYRLGASPTGVGIACLASSGGLLVYDGDLTSVLELDLAADRRTLTFTQSEIPMWGRLRNQIRCVGVGTTMERCLYSIADTVFCMDLRGNNVWAVCMPPNAGWERVVSRTNRAGADHEVMSALELLGLRLPVSHADIRSQYRALAMVWHPDLHPNLKDSVERMQLLNHAWEILTGVSPSVLSGEMQEKLTLRRTAPDSVISTGLFTITATFSNAPSLDWVYAASFSSDGVGAYIGSYSGKIVHVDRQGDCIEVFDVGSTPEAIYETPSHLYICTSTRMYVIDRNRRLTGLLDIHRNRVIVTTNGLAGVGKKCLHWYSPDGQMLGSLRSRHPIRQVYGTRMGLCVETRQHRAIMAATP